MSMIFAMEIFTHIISLICKGQRGFLRLESDNRILASFLDVSYEIIKNKMVQG